MQGKNNYATTNINSSLKRGLNAPRRMKITTSLFEAGIKCLTKCFLRSIGEQGTGNAYADWVRTNSDSYRREGTKRLIARSACNECINGLSGTENLKTAEWRLAVDVEAHASVVRPTLLYI